MQAGKSSPRLAGSRGVYSSPRGGRRGCCSGQLSKQCRVLLRWEKTMAGSADRRDRLAMEKTWDLGCEQNTGGWTVDRR